MHAPPSPIRMSPKHGSYEANPPFVPSIMEASARHIGTLLDAAEAAGEALAFTVILPGWWVFTGGHEGRVRGRHFYSPTFCPAGEWAVAGYWLERGVGREALSHRLGICIQIIPHPFCRKLHETIPPFLISLPPSLSPLLPPPPSLLPPPLLLHRGRRPWLGTCLRQAHIPLPPTSHYPPHPILSASPYVPLLLLLQEGDDGLEAV